MAEEEEKVDPALYRPENVGEDLAVSTEREVGVITDNLADTAHEVGSVIVTSIKDGLDKLGGLSIASSEPPPPPDVAPEGPPTDKAHDVIKEVAERLAPPAPGTQITLHDQLELAKTQMSQLGK